jgi:hypothetical protein
MTWTCPRMSDEDLRQWVLDFLADRVFTSLHIPTGHQDMLGTVFMPLALGGLQKVPEEEIQNIGLFWEYMHTAGPRAVNGLPMFMSMRFMHRDDAERAFKAIDRERKRQQEIEV